MNFSIETDGLNVAYGRIPVLWNISVCVPRGKMVAIIGPNGAGKSSFLQALLGLIPVLSGSWSILERPLSSVMDKIAYIPQKEKLDWYFPLTVLDFVLMGRYGKLGYFLPISRSDKEKAMWALQEVALAPCSMRQIGKLSGGQKQRLFLARALVQEAEIFFLDEPFAGIDVATENIIFSLFKKLQREGKSIFVVHHDLKHVEHHFDYVILMNVRLIASGAVKEVLTREYLMKAYGDTLHLWEQAFDPSFS